MITPNLFKNILCLFYSILLLIQFNRGSNLKQLNYRIQEESAIDTLVADIKLDLTSQFMLTHQSNDQFELYNESNLFRIHPQHGKLYVAKRIDRETICPSNLNELNETSLSAKCLVHLMVYVAQMDWFNLIIEIEDINDNSPYFPLIPTSPTYIVKISESVNVGYEILLISARDLDQGQNSVQSYALHGSDFEPTRFMLVYKPPYALKLVILDSLDAESKNFYHGDLIVCDGGLPKPRCTNQPFELHILDINDNKPKFDQSLYIVELLENAKLDSLVMIMNATDEDSGLNGQIDYLFGQPLSKTIQKHFKIDKLSGEIRVRSLFNAKQMENYLIPIIAMDRGENPLMTQTMVRVIIQDMNDHDPWIELRPNKLNQTHQLDLENSNYFWLFENEPIHTNLGLIIVGDDDKGNNSMVKCKLAQNELRFSLIHVNTAKDREIYRLITNQVFDCETLPRSPDELLLIVQLECWDLGQPVRQTHKQLKIKIFDLNEFRPRFLSNQSSIRLELEENLDIGSFIYQIQAIDDDLTKQIRYSLSREVLPYMEIEENTGIIRSRSILDRETMPQIRFYVFAMDNFTDEEYVLDETNEKLAKINLTIVLTDVNDNKPFIIGSKEFEIIENRPGFSDLVGQLSSVDEDFGSNGTVMYQLISTTTNNQDHLNDLFMINPDGGKIFATQKLDREFQSFYKLTVLVHDLGKPVRLSSTEIIGIRILDENDNAPQWKSLSRIGQWAMENSWQTHKLIKRPPDFLNLKNIFNLGILNVSAPIYRGQQILMLESEDLDSLINANVTYSIGKINEINSNGMILDQSVSSYFILDPRKGELVVGVGPRGMGLSESGIFEIYFIANDNGNPPLKNYARLIIQINAQLEESIFSNLFGRSGLKNNGIFSYLISTGQLSIILIIFLIFILCMTFVCLMFAFLSVRKRGLLRQKHFPNNKRKSSHSNDYLYSLQINGNSLHNDPSNLDSLSMHTNQNQLNSLGRHYYYSPIMSSVCTDNGSLYKWSLTEQDLTKTNHHFPPPVYNLCSLDQIHHSSLHGGLVGSVDQPNQPIETNPDFHHSSIQSPSFPIDPYCVRFNSKQQSKEFKSSISPGLDQNGVDQLLGQTNSDNHKMPVKISPHTTSNNVVRHYQN